MIRLFVISKFELADEPGTFVLAWTTTPWTLPGNTALTMGEKIKYIKVSFGEEKYILAQDNIEKIFNDRKYEIIGNVKTKDLVGKRYKPLFDYFGASNLENKENLYTIQTADFVTVEDGTGIVHIAPGFGEDDLNLSKEKKLPTILHVTPEGTFTKEVKDWPDELVKPKEDTQAMDKKIVAYLDKRGLVFKAEEFAHSYPFCWRCDTPLLNYATTSWFVKVTEIKNNLVKNNKKINWIPAHLREGRFGKWLAEAKDWAISRQRYWGAPLPVWRCQGGNSKSEILNSKSPPAGGIPPSLKNNSVAGQIPNSKFQIPNGDGCGEIKVIGSIEELEKLSGKKITDLHKHVVDSIEFKCEKCGGVMRRIPEVLDCWFESGSMPYAQIHYPFENKEWFEKNFPAEFIAEGVDQTRGWFYTLMVLSTALFNKPAFKNVIANGIVLAEDGQKMSKRLKNYPEPDDIIDKYGADALRLYLLTSPVMEGETLNFSEAGVKEALQKVIMLASNVLSFYLMYQNKKEFSKRKPKNILDRWILAKLNLLNQEVTQQMKKYYLVKATRPLGGFINELSTWYLRRSRQRFKDGDQAGINTLGYVLLEFSKIAAPFIPFMAEDIYRQVCFQKESVHLEDWPKVNKSMIDNKLLAEMDLVRQIVEKGLAARAEVGIKIRQPLASYMTSLVDKLAEDLIDLIKEELNVKEIIFGKKDQLDIKVTEELKLEGQTREIIRQINQLRKEQKFTIKDKIIIYQAGFDDIFEKFGDEIRKATITEKVEKGLKEATQEIEGGKIGIEKVG